MLIVGLGNIGERYQNTYHNVGFMVIDKLASLLNIKVDSKGCQAIFGKKYYKDEKIVLAKPTTYMNNSGLSVRELVGANCKSREELIVIYDDIDIAPGTIRVRKNGSAGTHNGMRSIISEIGQEFARIRVGIGRGNPLFDLADFVLSKISDDDREILQKSIDAIAESIVQYINSGDFDSLMRKLNSYK